MQLAADLLVSPQRLIHGAVPSMVTLAYGVEASFDFTSYLCWRIVLAKNGVSIVHWDTRPVSWVPVLSCRRCSRRPTLRANRVYMCCFTPEATVNRSGHYLEGKAG